MMSKSALKKIVLPILLILSIKHSLFAQKWNDSIFKQSSLINYYVSALAHDSMKGRETGKEGMMKAATFIAAQMKSIGLQPVNGNDGYFQYFSKLNNKDPYEGINVIGAIPGSTNSKEIVIFSAHYDHLGVFKRKKDSVYNGANDNASGTALMLQLAMYYRQTKPERTILFIAFSGEELGLKGSEDFAYSIVHDDVRAVLNFDMVGRALKNKVYLSGSEYGDMFYVLNDELFRYDVNKYGKQFFKSNAPVQDFFKRSDNYSFAVYGIPAHTISATPDSDKFYHQLSDEIQTLDFEFMNELVKTIFIATQSIVNGKIALRRINPN